MLNSINPKSGIPIHRQIADQIRRGVAAGLLAPGDQLPSVRALAEQLLINPNTAARVYRDLERDGLLETRRGQGTFIAQNASALAESERKRLISERLEGAAEEARAYGFSEEEVVRLLREILARSRRADEPREPAEGLPYERQLDSDGGGERASHE
jgi:GntR family transcriptional regulator